MAGPCDDLRCPCDHPKHKLGRIVQLSMLGGYTVVRGGELIPVKGSCFWENLEDLRQAAKDSVSCASDLVFKTGLSR